MYLVTRNDPGKHIMLSSFLSRVGVLKTAVVERNMFVGKMYSVDINDSTNIVLVDDPLAFWYAHLYLKVPFSRLRMWAFELYEFQLSNDSFRNITRNIFFGLVSWLAFRFAGSIIFPSAGRAEFCMRRYVFSGLRKKYKILHNIPIYPEPASSLPVEVERKLNFLRDRGKKLVIYSGSIQSGRDLSPIIDELEHQDKYHLILVGVLKGDYAHLNAGNLKSTTYLGNFSHEIVFRIYRSVKYGVLCYSNSTKNTEICAPVKIWEYLYSGIKIIGNRNTALLSEWRPFVDAFYCPGEFVSALDSIDVDKNPEKKIPVFNMDVILEEWSAD